MDKLLFRKSYVTEIENVLQRIEDKIDRKPRISPVITGVLMPFMIAGLTAVVSVYQLNKNIAVGEADRSIKQLETISAIVHQFSTDHPERTLLLMDIVKSADILETNVTERVEKYALSLTEKKLNSALAAGTEEASQEYSNTIGIISNLQSPLAAVLALESGESVVHVIAASDTTEALARNFRNQLIEAGFTDAKIIKTSKRFAVSVAYLPYAEAKEVEEQFEAYDEFNRNYPNTAFLQIQQPHWSIVE